MFLAAEMLRKRRIIILILTSVLFLFFYELFFAEFIKKSLDDFSVPIRFFNKNYSDNDFYGNALVSLVIVLENLYLIGENIEVI